MIAARGGEQYSQNPQHERIENLDKFPMQQMTAAQEAQNPRWFQYKEENLRVYGQPGDTLANRRELSKKGFFKTLL